MNIMYIYMYVIFLYMNIIYTYMYVIYTIYEWINVYLFFGFLNNWLYIFFYILFFKNKFNENIYMNYNQ